MSGERHTLVLQPDGSLILPDLTEDLLPAAVALGEPLPDPLPTTIGGPRLALARRVRLPLGDPRRLPEPLLWRWHARGAVKYRRRELDGDGVSWLDLKAELGRRLLGPTCRLCARRCAVDRGGGELGFCGLGPGLRITAPVRLWGEEPELGRPGLAFQTVGCGLRCSFCYKPENLDPTAGQAAEPGELARIIDDADEVEHVHWLGGDPDESLPAILEVHRRVRLDRPLVWNTHSYLTPAQALLLEGVVDAFVADLKFGPGRCAADIAGVRGYWPAATATLRRLARFDAHLLIRHVALPGHLDCCAAPVAAWLRENLPGATVRLLDQYQPLGPAGPLARRLSEQERARLRAMQQVY